MIKSKLIFSSADPFEVSAYINRHVGYHELKVSKAMNGASLKHVPCGDLNLLEIHYGISATVTTPKLEKSYHLQMVSEGSGAVRYKRKEIELKPGMAMIVPPNVEAEFYYSPNCTKLLLKIPDELMRRSCLMEFGHTPRSGVEFEQMALNLGANSTFLKIIELIYLESQGRGGLLMPSFDPLKMFFGARLLELFPNNLDRPSGDRINEEFFSIVDGYIESHIFDDIRPDQLAAYCQITQRTLYNRFCVGKGLAPSAYIKQKKMMHVHKLIMGGGERSVTKIALNLGFSHLGRFAADYKRMFGVLPSSALRRSSVSPESELL